MEAKDTEFMPSFMSHLASSGSSDGAVAANAHVLALLCAAWVSIDGPFLTARFSPDDIPRHWL